jgi:hypothetical protein
MGLELALTVYFYYNYIHWRRLIGLNDRLGDWASACYLIATLAVDPELHLYFV